MKKVLIAGAIALALYLLAMGALRSERVQDALLARAVTALAGSQPASATADSLRVFVCGSASPLGMTDQAQACIAVVTDEHFYLFDVGAGSNRNLARASLPMFRLDGIFLTHFHSDHISEIYEANLSSWVQGRPQPLKVFGGEGVAELVSGVNATYSFDREHRIEHHGEALLRPDLGILEPELVTATTVIEDGDLRILAYQASHPPVDPSLGFRIEYRGRSVVISGDSNVTDATLSISGGADLLLHDALSVPAVTSLSEGFAAEGRARISKIMADVVEYHASLESIIELGSQTDIGMVAYYHLVPNASNALFTRFFERDLPDNYLIATDRMWFDMPVGSKDIVVLEP